MQLNDYDTTHRWQATLIESSRITPEGSFDEVRELILEPDQLELPFELGQSVGVLAPGDPAFGRHDHLRLYSVADLKQADAGRTWIKICVKRCTYTDEYSGEEHPGVASNYLCDLDLGARVDMTGPYGLAFEVPAKRDANLILIGAGTGIAPFRALIKHIYKNVTDWRGQVRLFYGARSGLDLLYMNQENDDLAQYYDRDTFEAIRALSPRPHWGDPIDWKAALEQRSAELWKMLEEPHTYVYLAGLEEIREQLDRALAELAGSADEWQRRKAELVAGGRWVELLY